MVNVTVLVRDRPRLTKQALDSLQNTSDITVTIRDDWSHRETWDTVEDFSGCNSIKGRVVYHSAKRVGTGEARNDVIETSEKAFGRGDYLYLSDNDVFFYPRWLHSLIACYEESKKYGFKVLGAYGHPYHQPIENEQWVRCFAFDIKPVHALALQSMFMTWDVWDKYGPFCQTPPGKVCQSEDVDFTNKIKADGGRIGVVSPALVVNTGITNSFGEKIPGWEAVLKEAPPGVIVE